MFVALRRAPTMRTVLFLAWVWTVVAAYAVGDWLPRAVSVYYGQPLAVGIALFLAVSTAMAAIEYMAFASSYWLLARSPGAGRPLFAGAAWVVGEAARTRLFTGNPWALAGYSQVGVQPLIQIADTTGVYGISFLVVAVNAAITDMLLAIGRPGGPKRVFAALAIGGVPVALALTYGSVRLASTLGEGPPVEAAIVQGNLDIGAQWRPEFYGRNLDHYLRLTHDALRQHRPRIVFWPETAMTFFLDQEPLYRRAIGRVTAAADAELVAGGPRSERSGEFPNSAFLLAPSGEVLSAYDKQRLLPFTEYLPFSGLDLARRRFGRVREFTPGGPAALLATTAGAAGIVICNEAMFPDLAAARVRAGADYLVNLSNETWVGDPKYARIAFDMVSLRAVEQRRYLVRASTSGPSGIVDPHGHVLVSTFPDTQAVLAGPIGRSREITPYCWLGDAFAGACAVAVVLSLVGHAVGVRGRQ